MSGMAGMAGMGMPPMMMPGGMPMMGGGGEQCCKCIMANTPNSWQNVHCLPCMYHRSLLKWHYSIVIHVTANFGNSSMMNVLVYKLISSTMRQLLPDPSLRPRRLLPVRRMLVLVNYHRRDKTMMVHSLLFLRPTTVT